MTTVYNFEHKFNLKSYIDAFVKIGYKPMSNLMFFGLIGPSLANWSHKTRLYYYNKSPSVNSTKDINNAESHIKTTGLGFGGGIEYWATKNATVSFQYAMHIHRTKNIHYDSKYDLLEITSGGIEPVNRNTDVQKSVRLTYSTIGLRFSYFFSF